MAIERTFSIIKPDATARNLTGAINAMIEEAGLRIVAQKRVRITAPQAETVLRRAQRAAVLRRAGRLHDVGPGRGAGAAKARTPSRNIATSWARPIRPRRRPAPSARCTPNRSARIRCTAPTRADTAAQRDRAVLLRERDRRLTDCQAWRGGAMLAQTVRLARVEGQPWSSAFGTSRFWLAVARRSSGSTFCCPATTPSSSRWPAAACRRGSGCGA